MAALRLSYFRHSSSLLVYGKQTATDVQWACLGLVCRGFGCRPGKANDNSNPNRRQKMDSIALLRKQFEQAHWVMEGTMEGVTSEQAASIPTGRANSIGASYAHVILS